MPEYQPAVVIKNLYKTFELPHEQHSGIKQRLVSVFRGKRGYETQKVLKNVSFEIERGDFFGIVGRNGSGKSTLLKLLAGIYAPDKGLVQVNGSLTPFIELGVGFNPELTGRENVFMNGALLGFDRNQMTVMYDDIVEFAELEKFMDQKLKNYSSGMQVRLAFSIAIRAKSDILLIDEVLAVGDERFQQKCFEYFESLKSDPEKTVIIVTHDMESIRKYCTKVMVLNYGDHIFTGGTEDAVNVYHELNATTASDMDAVDKYEPKYLDHITVSNMSVTQKNKHGHVSANNPIQVRLDLKKIDGVGGVGVAIFEKTTNSYCYATNTFIDNVKISDNTISLVINSPDYLLPGNYFCKVGIFGSRDTQVLEFFDNVVEFVIDGSTEKQGFMSLNTEWRK
jgi:ABC-type polysaccharide/polyol phosphate transport system ATPase subunit